MARAGDTLVNPRSGEVIKFLKTTAETKGEYVQFEMICTKEGGVPFEHIHPLQSETFTIYEGSVYFKLNGKEVHVNEGETIVVAPGDKHIFLNRENRTLRAIVEVRPAMNFEYGIETIFGLSKDGKSGKKGQPTFLQMAVLTTATKGEFYLASMPIPIQKVVMGFFGKIGRVLGYKAFYKKYSGFEG